MKRKPKPSPRFKHFRIATAKIEPGDLVVLRTELHLSKDQAEMLRVQAKPYFPNNQILVLTSGVMLAVVKRDDVREVA